MAVNDEQRLGHEDGLHGLRVCRRDADGDEALPGAPGDGGAGAGGAEDTGRQMKERLDRGGADAGLKESNAVGDDGDRTSFLTEKIMIGVAPGRGKQVGSHELLGGEDSVHGVQRELPAAMEEIGEMGLSKAGLAGEQGDTERAALYPPEDLQA